MMKYPSDFVNKVICGDCLQLIDLIPDKELDGIVIDPPYGEGMGYEGDSTLGDAETLLRNFLKAAISKTKPGAHVAIFWTMRNLDVCIDVLREVGFNYRRTLGMYLPKGNARPYLGWLPRTQGIVIGQNYLPKRPSDFHYEMAAYLADAVERSGLSKSEVAKRLGCDSRLVMKWTRQGDPAWCLPTPRFYRPLKELLSLDDTFDVLLNREPYAGRSGRSDFEYKHDTYLIADRHGDKLHPSEKPLWVVEHVVTCLSPEGGLILDGFLGSGTTAVACNKTNRNFIGFEISEEYCSVARERIEALKS